MDSLLKTGEREGRLFEILDIFDQKRKDHNKQLLNIDSDLYDGDEDMQRIVRRLLMAASNVDVRQDMNIEDEIVQALDRKDDTIKEMGAQLAEQANQLAEQANQLAEKDNQLTEQANQLSEKDKALTTLAKHLLGEGLTISQVAKMTTLPVDIVEKIH